MEVCRRETFSNLLKQVGKSSQAKKGFFLETCERRSRKKKVSFNCELKLLILVRSVQSYILVCSCRRLAGFLERCVIEPMLSYRGTSALDQSRTADLRSVRLTSWECLPSKFNVQPRERMREACVKIKNDVTNFNVVFEWRGDGRTATFENVLEFAKTTRSWFQLEKTTASPHEYNVIDFEKKVFDDMVNNQRIGVRPTPSLDKCDRIMECMDIDELDEFFEMEEKNGGEIDPTLMLEIT